MRSECGGRLDWLGFGRNLGGRHCSSLLPRTLHFGLGTLVLAGGFAGGELASTVLKRNKYVGILSIAVTTLQYITISMITIFSMYIAHVR